jgi:RimJ/RimL family protein N-acetyltransferase
VRLPELTTRRLWLRPRQESDLPALIAIDSDPAVMRFVGDGSIADPASLEKRLRERLRVSSGDGLGLWSVFARDRRDDVLGVAGLVPISGSSDIELAYRFRAGAWGQGFATEAGMACLSYAFRTLELAEVVALVHPDNARSARVIAKLGFAAAGRRLAYGADLAFYRLGRAAFLQRQGAQPGR